jgi:anthranilate synthase component II
VVPDTTLLQVAARIVVIDNYDSFVYNLVQYLGELGAEPIVYRHDAIDEAGIRELAPDGLLVSPGPGRPEDAGISCGVIEALGPSVPVLGVCLGHQCIGAVFGAEVVRAPAVMHGKTSIIHHDGKGIFQGLQNPLVATRYHSLVVAPESVPAVLEVTATTDDGTIMGLRHRSLPVEGVQFHPESILTAEGHRLLANWLRRCGQPEALDRVS